MSTLRRQLNRRKGWIGTTLVFAICVMAIDVLFPGDGRDLPWIFFVGFAVFVGALFYGYVFLRCPACRERIGYLVMYGGNPFTVACKLRFCPACGTSLDGKTDQAKVLK